MQKTFNEKDCLERLKQAKTTEEFNKVIEELPEVPDEEPASSIEKEIQKYTSMERPTMMRDSRLLTETGMITDE